MNVLHAPSLASSPVHQRGKDVDLKILLAAANSSCHPSPSPVALPEHPFEWERLVAMAESHAVTPHLHSYLGRLPAETVPASVLLILKNRVTEGALHNLLLASELLTISRHLRARGIEHLAYKGPVMAATLFGGLDRRLSSDIDIVIPKSSLKQACSALADLQFVDKYNLTSSQLAAAFHFGFEHTFTRDEVDIDLHWRVVQNFVSPSMDEKGVWERAVEVPLFGQTVPTFCPEDLLIALCLHASGHEWFPISLFCDIAALLRKSPVDWDIVRRHLGDSNTSRIVFVSLQLTANHWNISLPPEIAACIAADREITGIVSAIENDGWMDADRHPNKEVPIRWLLKRTRGEKLFDRIRYAAGITLGPTLIDYQMFNLPRPLILLYPLLRAGRLGLKYSGRAAARRFKS